MKTYGPISAISNNLLFDEICNRIDATLSGFTTGWNIVVDARDSARVPTASGFSPFYRQLGGTSLTDSTTQIGAFNRRITIQTAIRNPDSGIIYLYFSGRDSGGLTFVNSFGYLTSLDGIDFAGPTYVATSGVDDAMISCSSRKMADGNFWLMSARGNSLNGNQARAMAICGNSTPVWVQGLSSTIQILASLLAPAKKASDGGFAFSWCPTNQIMHFFFPMDAGDDAIIHCLFSGATLAAATAAAGTTGYTYCQLSDLGVDAIYGISRMEEFPTYYLLWIGVLYQGDRRTIQVKETAKNFDTPIFDVISYADVWAAQTAVVDIHQSVALMRPDQSVEASFFIDDNFTNSAIVGNISFVADDADVDGNPDYQGLQYEYVTFKSTHTENGGNGYFMTLLQLNPIQIAPPSVVGITDIKPIFMRGTRNWTNTGTISHFFFDPIIPVGVDPTTVNLLAPCMATIPLTADSPDETFKLWLKCSPEQVFIFTESSGGLNGIRSQYLHYNIPTPLQTMNLSSPNTVNDNVIFAGAGWLTGKDTMILGRNNFPEISNIRTNARDNYQLGAQKSYAGVLTALNSVDGKNYPFPVYVSSNDAQVYGNAAINSFTYSPGILRETFMYTNMASVVTDDIVPVNSVAHKVFKATPENAAPYSANTPDNVLIKWA